MMRLSDLLECIPSDEFLTELWPAREYSSRRKGPYITRQDLIMVALYYEGYLHREIAWALDVNEWLVNKRLPNTFEKLEKVHVINDMHMQSRYPSFTRPIASEVLKQFENIRTKLPIEIARQEWKEAADELEKVKEERDILLQYVMFRSEIDIDLCMGEESAGRCPCYAHCENTKHCRSCILSHAEKLYVRREGRKDFQRGDFDG